MEIHTSKYIKCERIQDVCEGNGNVSHGWPSGNVKHS
jgi:hypothetical protein